MGAVQDGAGAAAASSQGMGGMGGDEDGFVVPAKTSAQVRPGAGDVGAPGSVSPWPPPSAKESRRVGVAIDAALSSLWQLVCAAQAYGSAKGLPWLK